MPPRLTLGNDLGEVGRVDAWMELLARECGLSETTSQELRLCLHELVANVIMHGCAPGAPHCIALDAECAGNELRLVLTDDARPFDPLSVAAPARLDDMEAAPIGGLGLALVRAYADRLDYAWDGRNRLTLTRRLG